MDEYDVVLEYSSIPVRIFNLRRDIIRVVYMTDQDNEIIRSCKDSISEYCTEYKYNFIHYNSGIDGKNGDTITRAESTSTSTVDNVLPSSFRDVKDRLELIHDLFIQDDFVLVIYNYSVIVNQRTPLHLTTECIFDKSSNIVLKIDTEDNIPVLDNLMIRNTPRALSVLKELIYYAYDLPRMMNYIRLYLFKEVSYTMYYSYFNKRMKLNQVAMSYDMMYNFNNTAEHIDTVSTLVNFYCRHKNIFSHILPIDGKTYTWGGGSVGCIGTIQFSKGHVTTSNGHHGIYTWTNASTYRIEFDESDRLMPVPISTNKKFVITLNNDGTRFTGYSENGIPCSIYGFLLPFAKI
jgi:hypothetical protein